MNSVLSKWKRVSDGVFVPRAEGSSGIISIGSAEIEELKVEALKSEKKRARICAHEDSASLLHQMLLVIQKESYVRPHRHHSKVESFHLIEGEMDVVIFSDEGHIQEVIPMRAFPSSSGVIFYRLNRSLFHTLVIHSPYVVFHEITQGPFKASESEYAQWAPSESDTAESGKWMANLVKECQRA